jgi:hypothetical protein
MTELPIHGVLIVAGVLSLLFLAWAFLLLKMSGLMSTALIADISMGLAGIAMLLWVDRVVGAIFLSASVVAFSIVSGALWIRPMRDEDQKAEADNESQSKASR